MTPDLVEVSGPLAVTVTTVMFILTYSQLPWHATKWGRSIMIMAFAVLGLAVNTLLWRLDELLPGFDTSWSHYWPRVVAWWVLAGGYVWKTMTALRALRGGPDDGDSGDDRR